MNHFQPVLESSWNTDAITITPVFVQWQI